ncbi:uncharacterized protein [Amphiura filiformis]|uniref:uncharacterized protein n=1 Tax=Amphiura filiformis TaxID=82378 RepID=UPI003B225DA8
MAKQISTTTKSEKKVLVPYSVSPSLDDFRLIDPDSTNYLSRLNKVQQGLLEHELHDLQRQEDRILREAHLQMCVVAKDRLELRREKALHIQRQINTQGRLLPMSPVVSPGTPRVRSRNGVNGNTDHQGRRTSVSDITGLVANGMGMKPKLNMSRATKSAPDGNFIKDSIGQTSEGVDDQDKNSPVNKPEEKPRDTHVDYKLKEEISRLKRSSVKTRVKLDSSSDMSIDRGGRPLLPTSSFIRKQNSAKPSETVFNRLSKSSNVSSMTSEVFFRNVKIQAARRTPRPRDRHARTPPDGSSTGKSSSLSVIGDRPQRPRSLSPRPRKKLEN